MSKFVPFSSVSTLNFSYTISIWRLLSTSRILLAIWWFDWKPFEQIVQRTTVEDKSVVSEPLVFFQIGRIIPCCGQIWNMEWLPNFYKFSRWLHEVSLVKIYKERGCPSLEWGRSEHIVQNQFQTAVSKESYAFDCNYRPSPPYFLDDNN